MTDGVHRMTGLRNGSTQHNITQRKNMDIQRVRNLTTGRLHTTMSHIYEDIEFLVGTDGIMTHQLSNANQALQPFLEERIADKRFFDGKYDPEHIGEIDIKPLDEEEQKQFWHAYGAMPSLLANIGKGKGK